MERVIGYLATFIIIILALPVHEFAHAYAAVKAGDPTPKLQGRYTINPLKHFDLLGLVMLMVAHFGWAKPVPINPYNFRNLKRDYFRVSIAGILANLFMAIIFSFLLYLFSYLLRSPCEMLFQSAVTDNRIFVLTMGDMLFSGSQVFKLLNTYGALSFVGYFGLTLIYFVLIYGVLINVNLMIFNLIPVYPLDGFRMLDSTLKKKGKFFWFLRTKGHFVLIGLLIWSAICGYLEDSMPIIAYFDILGNLLTIINNFILKFFTSFWELIFLGSWGAY